MSVIDKEGFRKVIVGLSGLGDTGVVWALDDQPFVSDSDRARIVLQVFSIASLGWDEYRRAYGPPGYPPNAFVTTTIGNRTVVITMRAETFDSSVEASELIDAVYTGMQSVETDMALDAIRMAFVEAHPAVFVSYVVDQRMVNASTRDFVFGAINQKVVSVVIDGTINPAPSAPGDYIDTVDGDNIIPGTITP